MQYCKIDHFNFTCVLQLMWCACVLSHFSCVQLIVIPWTVTCQAPLSMGSPGKNTGIGCHFLLQNQYLMLGIDLESIPINLEFQRQNTLVQIWAQSLSGCVALCRFQPVHPKGDQFWVFIGRTDAEAETPILWPPRAKSWLIGKDPDAGRDWRQEEKGTTEHEMVGWHHRLNGYEFE